MAVRPRISTGVASYRFAIGTAPGGTDVQGFRLAPRAASNAGDAGGASAILHRVEATPAAALEDGVRYYVSVMAVWRPVPHTVL